MNVRHVMTSPVVTVSPDTPFREVVRSLIEHDVSGVPVVDVSGTLVGIVTEADLISKEAFAGRRQLLGTLSGDSSWTYKADGVTAGDVMTHHPFVVEPDDEVGASPAGCW